MRIVATRVLPGPAWTELPGVEVGTLARVIRMRGRRMAPGCTLDTPRDVTLVSVFCIPLTSNILVNGAASLPGPGATSLPGTITLRR